MKRSERDFTKNPSHSRRNFLKRAGAGVAATGMILTLGSCDDDDDPGTGGGGNGGTDMDVDLGSGDAGILNYAYALEQLEAAFYTQVTASFYTGATDTEKRILEDLRKHEVAHRDFFEAAISTVAEPIPGLTPDFSSIDFADRTAVLSAARTFENLGVAAYNGAGQLLTSAEYLVIAGKIVSIEARHASVINYMIDSDPTAFGVNPLASADEQGKGLDAAMMPSQVLSAAQSFIMETIDGSNLPTS